MRPNRTAILALFLAAFMIRGASAQGVCGAPNVGDCCVEGANPGCADAKCCASVCAVDPFCCEESWDGYCAARAVNTCSGCLDCGSPQAGDCCVAS